MFILLACAEVGLFGHLIVASDKGEVPFQQQKEGCETVPRAGRLYVRPHLSGHAHDGPGSVCPVTITGRRKHPDAHVLFETMNRHRTRWRPIDAFAPMARPPLEQRRFLTITTCDDLLATLAEAAATGGVPQQMAHDMLAQYRNPNSPRWYMKMMRFLDERQLDTHVYTDLSHALARATTPCLHMFIASITFALQGTVFNLSCVGNVLANDPCRGLQQARRHSRYPRTLGTQRCRPTDVCHCGARLDAHHPVSVDPDMIFLFLLYVNNKVRLWERPVPREDNAFERHAGAAVYGPRRPRGVSLMYGKSALVVNQTTYDAGLSKRRSGALFDCCCGCGWSCCRGATHAGSTKERALGRRAGCAR